MLSRQQWFALEDLQNWVERVCSMWSSHKLHPEPQIYEELDKALDVVIDLFPSTQMHADLIVDPLTAALKIPTWPFEWVDLDEAKELLAHAEAPGYIPAGQKSQEKIMHEVMPAMLKELEYLRKVAYAARNFLDEDSEPKTVHGFHHWRDRLWHLTEYGDEN